MMGKAASTFKEADVTRAFKAAKKAGVVVEITVDLEHKKMTLTPIALDEAGKANEWDEVYNGKDHPSTR